MDLHFKESGKIILGQDVFMSVNVINGKCKLTLYKARRIPSITDPHRTICIPGPSGICIDYEQYIQLVEKAPLLTSIISSIKENSDKEKTKCEIQQKPTSLRDGMKRPRRCNDKTISNDRTVRKLDGESNLQRKPGSRSLTLPLENHVFEHKILNQKVFKDLHTTDTDTQHQPVFESNISISRENQKSTNQSGVEKQVS